jgi:hypothetical protein
VEYSRHPLVVTLVGFFLTGILGAYLTSWLNSRSHLNEKETSVRENAIAAVTDISELFHERRQRGRLVASAMTRKAPETEVTARKTGYDEAFVRWNVKIPGDLLRMRAGLHWSRARDGTYDDWSRLRYEKYIDTLISAEMLFHLSDKEDPPATRPGLFRIMDDCLTKAFDAYRTNSFLRNEESIEILSACKFSDVHAQSVRCFARIAEALYKAVNEIGEPTRPHSDEPIIAACNPPN